MDPFEVRMNFLAYLKKMNASQQSIQKVVNYAVKYFPSCGEDLWDCIVESCQKGTINTRINVLYFLDSLCEACLLVRTYAMKANQQGSSGNLYVQYLSRDISKIVESVVPPGREGLPNLISTKQILQNWRTKRVIETSKLDDALSILDSRTSLAQAPDSSAPASSSSNNHAHHHHHRSLERHEVLRRIEEDRERHKRLRERRWVQPVSYNNPLSSFQPPPLASFLPLTDPDPADGQGELLPIDIEFENEWETTSDWNEDDDEAALEEAELCFPAEGEGPMDLS